MRFNKHYSAAVIAFVLWGFFSLALKPLQNYGSLDILFYRVFFSAILLLFINLTFRKNVLRSNWNSYKKMTKQKQRNILILTLGGSIFMTFNWFFFIYIVTNVSVKAASLAYLICPILTTVLAFFILKEKLNSWQLIAVFISFVSCVLLSLHHFQDVFYSLIVALSYAMYLVSQRNNIEIDNFIVLSIQLIFTSFILLPFYPSYSGAFPTEPLFYECILLVVVVFTIIPLLLNLFALKGLNSSSVGILLYICPIINFLIAIFYYNEPLNLTQLVSYFLILISIIVFNKKLLFPKNTIVITADKEF